MEKKHAQKAVILLEDEEDIADLLAQLISAAGALPVVCRDQESVLRAIDDHDVVLALLDIMLPEVDGREVAAALRAKKVTFPIYFMTGIKAKSIGNNYHALADGVLYKPFSLQELRDLLARFLSAAAAPAADDNRKILELMAVIASEQEDIRRHQKQLMLLLKTPAADSAAAAEMWQEFGMSLEASLNRQAAHLAEMRQMLERLST